MTVTIYWDAGLFILLYFARSRLVFSSYILNLDKIIALLFHVLEVIADINPHEIIGLLSYPNSIFKKEKPNCPK